MIKAYLAGIPTLFEGEDIEVRYSIYKDEELLSKKSVMMHYRKPAIVGQVALVKLLKELKQYMGQEVVIIINDASLNEVIRGTSTTENKDVLKMADRTRKELIEFGSPVIKDVSANHMELREWNEILKF